METSGLVSFGMETKGRRSQVLHLLLHCKYLTYKEWKHSVRGKVYYFRHNSPFCKYLTYKEWKHAALILPSSAMMFTGKYLTYKEWKPFP